MRRTGVARRSIRSCNDAQHRSVTVWSVPLFYWRVGEGGRGDGGAVRDSRLSDTHQSLDWGLTFVCTFCLLYVRLYFFLATFLLTLNVVYGFPERLNYLY